MNKMKKLLSVVLAVVLAFSALSVLGSAAKTSYQTVENLTALDAYSPYGQVTRLSLEARTSIVFDALDNLLGKANINMGKIFDVLGLSVTIDLTSIDRLCYSFDTIKSTFNNTLASIAMGIVDLGILESLNVDNWQTGMSRSGTAQFTILSTILSFLSSNTTLIDKLFTDGLDLGIVSLGDMSAIEDIVLNLPGFVKGLVYPMIERWDDNLAVIRELDNSIAGTSEYYNSVEAVANWRVKKLFSDNMSITTIKYDVNGNMTSEHTNWLATATGSAAPTDTPTDSSIRCYYQINGNTMYSYHIVNAKEAEALAKDSDDSNNVAAYKYIKDNQVYRLEQEVPGSATYVWKAYELDKDGNVVVGADGKDKYLSTLKYYNDDSNWLEGISGDDIDLTTMSLADLLYKFIPPVFANMAPVVLNGSVKKILADFLGASFNYVGQVGDDAVNALPDASNAFFTQEQGEYLWEWSDYAVINGNHYYRFEDQIFAGDLSNKNNYFDIINWDYKIGADFINEFIPTNPSKDSTFFMNFNNFLVKVAELALKPSASTVDTISGFEAEWVRPAMTKGDNSNLVTNLKAVAQAVIGLAPQHVFGSDWETNPRCYVKLMLDSDNDTVLAGIAAHLVNMIMPSVTLPFCDDLKASKAKVGAILAAVVREFAAYLAPEYDFDALIYTDFGTTTADPVKTFVDPEAAGLLTAGQTPAGYWFDVILTMGINIGFEYLRAFSDMGEGTSQWNSFVAYSGYGVDGKTYAAGTTQAALNAEWEGMLDYILDWALSTDVDWAWAMGNLVSVDGEVNMATAQDPWKKLDAVLNGLLPVDEILNVTATDCETELEQLLRYDLILALVELRWGDLFDLIKVPDGFVRQANVLDALAAKLKGIVNFLFAKVGNTNHNFALIPSVITDFDSLANQANLKTMVKNLVGALYTAGVTNGGARTLLPFLNFLLGWKTDPQKIADPEIWTSFRDGNDYAFQWTGNGVYPSIEENETKINILNNSAGMLETHRNSDVTDHAYDIQIKSVTSDATVNTLTFNYGDGLISPYETLAIKIGGTYKGEEAATITIAYDYVGKDGSAIGGTQYTSLTILFSNQYEDANISGRKDGDDDTDYAGTDDFGRYQFTEDIYDTVVNYQARIFYVGSTFSNPSKSRGTIAAPDWDGNDCDGKTYYNMTGNAATYFDFRAADADAGWASTLSKDGTSETYGYLYKAKSGVTAETEFPYGVYDMGRIAVAYGSDNKTYEIEFIYYNDYDIYDIYTENQWNGYNAHQGVDEALYNEYNAAWRDIVKYATYPMMTEANNNAATDYVKTIQPKIPAAIERFETAKKDYELALADAQASGAADSALPAYVEALQAEIDNDFMNGKEINFQDYEFYEYFNYSDVKEAAEDLYRSYLAPEVMDRYYILGSGIREEELDDVIAAESNPFVAAGISASRLENDADAIAESQRLHDEWKQPINTKLYVEDFTSRLAFYKQFLNEANREGNDHLKFLEREIAHVEAQGLDSADYTEASWANYAEKLAVAKAVAAGNDEFAAFNSRIYDVKYNLMVAYKNLLSKEASLIEAGGTADLLANIEKAEAIFASLEAGDGVWALSEEYEGEADDAYAALISALGYYYVGEDGNTWNLYADSAYEYRDNDRPDNQNNQAKVNASNAALEAAILNFEGGETAEPVLSGITTGHVDVTNKYVYGVVAGTEDFTEFFTVENGSFKMVANDAGYTNGTGATLVVMNDKGEEVDHFTLVIFGDVNGDGAILGADKNAVDICLLANSTDTLSEAQVLAADVNGDGDVAGADKNAIDICLLTGDQTTMTVNPFVN